MLQKTEPLEVEIRNETRARPFPQLTLMGLEQRLTDGAVDEGRFGIGPGN